MCVAMLKEAKERNKRGQKGMIAVIAIDWHFKYCTLSSWYFFLSGLRKKFLTVVQNNLIVMYVQGMTGALERVKFLQYINFMQNLLNLRWIQNCLNWVFTLTLLSTYCQKTAGDVIERRPFNTSPQGSNWECVW